MEEGDSQGLFLGPSKDIPIVIEKLDLGPSQSPGDGRSYLACIGNTGDDMIDPSAGAFASVRNQLFNDDRYTPLLKECL